MTDPQPAPHRWLILGAGGHGRSVADAIRAGEVLGCRESRFAELALAPGAADLSEGVSCRGPAC